MTTSKVLSWCREQALFPVGATVTAALSGGADSVAMLHLLLSLRGELGITLRAAHYNHHLRGEASEEDEDFCRALCRSLDVPLRCGGGDVAAFARERKISLELAARKLRYAFLLAGDGLVATAHNAGDSLETVLMNLTRGAALRGLCGIPPKRERVVRPLLCLSRREIEDYLAQHGLPHVNDESNSQAFCRRNRIRSAVVPVLLSENPSLLDNFPRTLRALREDEELLRAQSDALLTGAEREGGFDAAALLDAPRPLRRRALRRLLEDAGLHDVTAAHLEAAETLLQSGPSARLDLPGGVTLRRVYALVTAQAEDWGPFAPFRLPMPGEVPLSGGRTLCCQGPLPFDPALPGLVLRPPGPLLVRPRRPGDRLRLAGGEKSIKKLLIDKKIPAALRDSLPVLEWEGRVAAAWGVGADPAFRPRMGEDCYQILLQGGTRHDAPRRYDERH